MVSASQRESAGKGPASHTIYAGRTMKRFLIGAVAAAALAMPAGASASTGTTSIADQVIPPCPTTNLSYCVKYWLSSSINLDPVVVAQCTTPVMPCVQETVGRAFTAADNAILLAKAYTYWAIDQIDDPPPIQEICNLIWGQDCARAIAG